MNFNDMAKDIHENSVQHGWWNEPRTFGEVIALCHSELSEALEEYRDHKPNIYYICKSHDTRALCPDQYDGCQCGENAGCNIRKPEGVATELADCVIRILDYYGSSEADVDNEINKFKRFNYVAENFGAFISDCHKSLSYSYAFEDTNHLALCVCKIYAWAEINSVDMDEVIRIKHEFNKTRSYKHGNKVM